MSRFAGARRANSLWKLGLTASALALSAALPGIAWAQDTTPAADDQTQGQDDQAAIVVTGIRAGLRNSINLKRDNTSIVEAVSAEDIGKLPDVSIAESIARLPGLAAQRVNGRAQVISIRGLAPDFTTTLLNGRAQASSGDNRAVEFDQYPSELLSSVVIYKTPDAEVSGMGLSGTADLRTVRPLAFGKRAIALNVRGELTEGGRLNSDVRNWGGRASISYIDQFANGTLGVAFGYAHLDSPSKNMHYKAYGYEPFGQICEPGNSAPPSCSPDTVTPDSADPDLFLNGQEVFATSRLNRRDAWMGIVEWQPSEGFHSTLDLYYSKFHQEETMRGAQWFSNGWADGASFTNVQSEDRGGSPFAVSGTANRVVPILRNDWNTRDDEIFSAGWNNEFKIGDRTHLVADFSYSNNRRKEQVLETYAGYGVGVGFVSGATPDAGRTFDTIGFNIPDNNYPTYSEGLNYAAAAHVSLGDRAPWGGWGHDGAIRFPDVEESIYAVDLKGDHEFDGFLNRITIGGNFTRRDKHKTVDDNDLFLKNGRQQVLVDPQYLVSPTSLGYAGFGDVLSIDLSRALGVYYNEAPIRDANYYDKTWQIQEDLLTGYLKGDFASGPIRGNIGVQIVRERQESTGVVINATNSGPVVPTTRTQGATYTDLLPSANLIWDLGGGHRFRLAASRTMARPRMDEMRANVTPGFDSLVCTNPGACTPGSTIHPWSASGGNPLLKPWRAWAFDAAYEWYINKTTYFSIAGFYKKLSTYIYNQTSTFDFTGIPIPSGVVIPAGVTVSPIGSITLPANGNGGTLKGIEISGALDFGTIIRPLEGLGVLGSVSFTDSDLNPTAGNDVVRIPGLSGTIYNITGYYEKGGFQLRASYRYRSAFKGEVTQLFATRGQSEILADRQVDAQVGYTFDKGALNGFGVLLQVTNLTDSPYRTRLGLDTGGTHTADGQSLLETYEKYGRQFLFGFNYRF
jgi:iron complex outermembrane receptor protein